MTENSGRGARQPPSQGAGELGGGQRGPGGGERGQHGEGVDVPVLAAAGAAGGLAAVRQQRLELGNQVGRMKVEAAGDLDEDLYRPAGQRRGWGADHGGGGGRAGGPAPQPQ